jgi:hypothetical protein
MPSSIQVIAMHMCFKRLLVERHKEGANALQLNLFGNFVKINGFAK